ncbi:MAG: Methionyl-tRNA formyltransferase [Gemmatimonadetes bacterium]|nr:Methionyl-tRNA formyltransferase [Gemmatimonadota bacterium]
MRVLFWGTPEFAVPPLRALLGEGFDVVGVVTQPDKAVGRSRSTLQPPAVKVVALEEGLPVLQPEKPRGEAFEQQLRELAPDVSVVVAYGHLLPEAVIATPRLGTLNIHASLLPRWRGAAPIQAALLHGDAETGVCIMRMVRALDAGPVLISRSTPILDDEAYGELQMRLSELGAMALIEALALLELGASAEAPQDASLVTYAPKIEREATRVDFTQDASAVSRQVRAYDPRPGAFGTLDGRDVKLFCARVVDAQGTPGEVLAIDGEGAVIACGTGAIRVGGLQPSGKARLTPSDWARGRGITIGGRFATTLS